ncbi:MAG: SUMF1/EgtB/PvdO family nonheme iron enzyme, partial [Desulfobacterales bacterium]|nr:SUMF1/EgtB/PvdO family nonheme iron enzyme [Desulfobacterales bacterium]
MKARWLIVVSFYFIFGCFATSLNNSNIQYRGSDRDIGREDVKDVFNDTEQVDLGENHAFLIGINKYKNHTNLKTPLNDVREIASILYNKYSFSKENIVILEDENATQENIINELRYMVELDEKRKIDDIERKRINGGLYPQKRINPIKKGDNVFIYYAGHGKFDDALGIGYWVTTEATSNWSSFLNNDVVYQCIKSLNKKKRVRHVYLVSDSCFSGAFVKDRSIAERIDDRYFIKKYFKPSRIVLTSGGIEPVSDEGYDDHSIFAYYFLKILKDEKDAISAKDLGVKVEKLVTRNSNQSPISKYIHGVGDEEGDFFFIARAGNGSGEPKKEPVIPVVVKTTITVESDVTGAEVRIGGQYVGRTPLRNYNIKPGNYRIVVIKEGYESFEKNIYVESGLNNSVYADLSKLYGKLSVNVNPSYATVKLSNVASFYNGMSLSPGNYKIEISANKHESQSLDVFLKEGENKILDIRLKPKGDEPVALFINKIGQTFVYIKPGTFTMGSPEEESGRDSDEVQHPVTISKGFYMQTTEVTVGQWKDFVDETEYKTEAETGDGAYGWTGSEWKRDKKYNWKNPGFSQDDTHPVTCVSWNDVKEFVSWLNRKENTSKYRLPTEAEWEYSARAGSETAFANGGISETGCNEPNLDKMGWYCGNSENKTHPVAQKQENAWGLYDMHGNVWEWCLDVKTDYSQNSTENPIYTGKGWFDFYKLNMSDVFVDNGSNRVLRGGSWLGDAGRCRSANRGGDAPAARSSYGGFRVAASLG